MSFIGNAISSLFGGITGSSQQADAAQQAAQIQANSQAQAQAALQQNLAPYQAIGGAVLPQILQNLGGNSQYSQVPGMTGFSFNPFSFNASNLQNTPGYQFTLQQGLKNTNNALSSQGLLGSGAQAKALSDYTTGLASNTYNQQFQNALNSYNANYNTALGGYQANMNPLLSLLGTGQNSAAGVGQGAYNSAVNAGNALAQGVSTAGSQQANTLNSLLGLGTAGAGIYSAYALPSALAGLTGAGAAGGSSAAALAALLP